MTLIAALRQCRETIETIKPAGVDSARALVAVADALTACILAIEAKPEEPEGVSEE